MTTPDLSCLKLKSIQFLKLSGSRVLTVVTTYSGIVKTKTIATRDDLPPSFLRDLGKGAHRAL